jgi:hypothetical protein
MSGSVSSTAHTERTEAWGPINAMLTEFTSRSTVGSALSRRSLRSHWPVEDADADVRPDLLIVASGNLAMLYLPRHPGRLSLEQLTDLHPDLVAGLAAHPGIGFVVVATDARGPVVVNEAGLRVLADGAVEGDDPLARYGGQIAADLLEHSRRDHVGDVVVCSLLEEGTGGVAAFEELVGCHGGAGGSQTRAVLLHPATWSPPDAALTSSNQVHRQLVHWLENYGRRAPAA